MREKALELLYRSNDIDRSLINYYNRQIRRARNGLKKYGDRYYYDQIRLNLKNRSGLRDSIERRNNLIKEIEGRDAV